MDAKLVNPIIDAFMEIMPQMGFPTPKRQRIYLQDRNVISNGVVLVVGFTRQMQGKVVYNMTADTAKYIASTMMMGVPVTKFGELVQSALREMSNMLTARAATNFTELGLDVDITTPELIISEDHTIKISDAQYLTVEMEVGGHIVDIALDVNRNA
ncbi:MAG: chemotaxis protein CheX [Selenomonadaceae bacterium]|nr:chemotaxis protein CheX [Selenomonadaceae bacterium]MBQ6758877.1 chemotaxis protein CheX [Selenomonadaceae bacterium]MBR0103641.1 chemotaxis protein CheX [Selenomonadaceae bacterium]